MKTDSLCKTCNTPLAEERKFCNVCGTKQMIPDNGTKQCPYCAESIKSEAVKCKHCSSELGQAKKAPPYLEPPKSEDKTDRRNLQDAVLAGNFISAIGALSAKDQAIYNSEVERRKKSTGIAYLFYFIMHWCGAEKFYLGERNWGFAYLLTPLLFVGSLLVGLWLGAIVIAVVYLSAVSFDLFCIPGQVRKANDRIRGEILSDLCGHGPKRREGWLDAPQTWIVSSLTVSLLTLGIAGIFLFQKYQDISSGSNSAPSPITTSDQGPKQARPTDPNPAEDSSRISGQEQTPVTPQTPLAQDNNAQPPVDSSPSGNANDAPSIIEQLLKTVNNGDEPIIIGTISNLEALPKPEPGNSSEATRLNKLGLQDLSSKNYTEAITTFGLASKADPSDAKYLSNLGFAEMKAGNLDSAQSDLCLSIGLAPTRAVAWGDLGEVLAKKGQQDKAVASFLVGFKVSDGKTLGYLQSLDKDDDPTVRLAGEVALKKATQARALGNNAPVDPTLVPEQARSAPFPTSTDTAPKYRAPEQTQALTQVTVVPKVGTVCGIRQHDFNIVFDSRDVVEAYDSLNANALERLGVTGFPIPDNHVCGQLTPDKDRVQVLEIADGAVADEKAVVNTAWHKKSGAYVRVKVLSRQVLDDYGQPCQSREIVGWIPASVLTP